MSRPLNHSHFISGNFSAGGPPFTRLVSQRLASHLAWVAWRLNISPNQLTLLSLAVSLSGSVIFASYYDSVAGLLAALGLWQLGYAADCADGQLARASSQMTARGAWLDPFCDIIERHAFALACFLVSLNVTASVVAAAIPAFLFAATRALQIHTASRIRSTTSERVALVGIGNMIRQLGNFVIDQPVTRIAAIVVMLAVPTAAYGLIIFLYAASLLGLAHCLYTGLKLISNAAKND